MAFTYPLGDANRNGFVRITGMDAKLYTNKNSFYPTTPHIELPLPLEGLKYTDGMSYENQNFGLLRNALIGEGGPDLSGMKRAAQDVFGNIKEPGVAKGAISTIAAQIGINLAQVNSRTTPNPNTRSIFKSPNLREFSFGWKLNPISVEEADMIKLIIKTIRTEMYPKRMFPEQETRIGYKYPSIWSIAVFLGPDDKKLQVEPFFKPCWLVNMDVTTGTNAAVLGKSGKDLNFAETTINMRFQEEVAITSEDVKDGY